MIFLGRPYLSKNSKRVLISRFQSLPMLYSLKNSEGFSCLLGLTDHRISIAGNMRALLNLFILWIKFRYQTHQIALPGTPPGTVALSGQLQTDSCPSYTPQSLGRTHCKSCVLSPMRLPVPPQGRRFEWTKQPHSATALGFISRICMFIWEEPVPPSVASLRGLFRAQLFWSQSQLNLASPQFPLGEGNMS